METQTSYTQLRPEDRVVIAGMTRLGASVRAIARTLDRSPSTISRELARNRSPATHGRDRPARPTPRPDQHPPAPARDP